MNGSLEMPNDIDAEKAVIGAVLLDKRCLADAASEVIAEDFYHPAHRALWEAVIALDRKSAPIDAVSIADQMRGEDQLKMLNIVGGESYMGDLLLDVVTTTSVAYHARSVARKADRRRWIWVATKIRSAGLGDGRDDDFLQEAEREFLALTARKRSGGPQVVREILRRVVKTLETRYENRDKHAVTGIASGLVALDTLTSGWQKSDLVIVAGRPSMGKTSLAMCSAVEAARSGVPVLFFSLEMSAEALVERTIAMEGNVDSAQLRSGQIKKETWMRLSPTCCRIAEMPIWIEEQSGLCVGEIRSRARRWRLNDAARAERVLIVVDYIGLVRPDNDNPRNREREVAEVSAGLKALAKDLASPVMVLSQLNRTCESRMNKRPMLSDLRESGSLEQDADVIAFLYRDEWYHNEPPRGQCDKCGPGIAEIVIAKQRNGATGCAHVAWQAETTKFVNLSRRHEAESFDASAG